MKRAPRVGLFKHYIGGRLSGFVTPYEQLSYARHNAAMLTGVLAQLHYTGESLVDRKPTLRNKRDAEILLEIEAMSDSAREILRKVVRLCSEIGIKDRAAEIMNTSE